MLFLLPSEIHMVKLLEERKVPISRKEVSVRALKSLVEAMRREYATDPELMLLAKKVRM